MLLLSICLLLTASDTDLEVAEAPVGLSDRDVTKAERLYEEARYEKALAALSEGCARAAEPVRCERIKAFIHIALGEAFEARACFDRMLVHDPNASLGPDVSPKLQGMFADAKRAMVDVKAMRLEPIAGSLEAGAPILLEVKGPSNSMVELLTVHLAGPGSDDFETIGLRAEGEVWSGSWDPTERVRAGPITYFLHVTLAGGVDVPIGNEIAPFDLELPEGEEDWSVTDPIPPPVVEEKGLPGWVPWAIGGGGAVVVGAVVAIIIGVVVGGQTPPPGDIELIVSYDGG